MKEIATWRPLDYTFDLEPNTEWKNESRKWVIMLEDTNSEYGIQNPEINVIVHRLIPKDTYGNDSRSQRNKRKETGFEYSVCIEWTENLWSTFSNSSQTSLSSAINELVTIISIELEDCKENNFSPEIDNIIQAAKLEAALIETT